ncbi:AMMECR1 domain-containing protein [Sulfurimonas sp.]|uniref:AMMECR1 domain-containing protein n=1 Tax=Sulfurimonas sp. TaxID=2022749 RepID=UPI002AAF612D|nr:AMMECR1 domain-containing protein [Sulfurimonas sp.]
MSRSVLLQLARDSIQEVLQAQRSIDKNELLTSHPLLKEKIATTVNLYINQKLRGSFCSQNATKTLLEDIVHNAKMSAFQDKNFSPLTTSEYLDCEIELLLNTPDGVLSEKDTSILNTKTHKTM